MPRKPKCVIVMGTLDTKGPELAYLAKQITQAGCKALLMDVGVQSESHEKVKIPVEQVANAIGEDIASIRALPRGEAVEKISQAAAICLKQYG